MIRENISRLKSDISLICQKLGRNPGDITFVCITKFANVAMIEEALDCGITDIGENKVQEAKAKFAELKPRVPQGKRHMIGHLQTNKVRDALKLFDMIQSLDSLRLAAAIEKEAEIQGREVDTLLEVNVSGEEQKHGVSLGEAQNLLKEVSGLKRLRILGLMTVAPLTQDEAVIRHCFRKLKELCDQLREQFKNTANIKMDFLSMGMSSDYRIALEEGANMARVGSAIFKHA